MATYGCNNWFWNNWNPIQGKTKELETGLKAAKIKRAMCWKCDWFVFLPKLYYHPFKILYEIFNRKCYYVFIHRSPILPANANKFLPLNAVIFCILPMQVSVRDLIYIIFIWLYWVFAQCTFNLKTGCFSFSFFILLPILTIVFCSLRHLKHNLQILTV